MSTNCKRILAISSGGGHWVELLRIAPAFEGHAVTYVTVSKAYQSDIPDERLLVVNDATRWDRLALILMACRIMAILIRVRPHVIVTTGAAPGYFALMFGRRIRAKTVWIDSIANVEELSLSGQMAGRYADLWLTQWPHLARDGGPTYAGAVM